jgi:hypothetical protein
MKRALVLITCALLATAPGLRAQGGRRQPPLRRPNRALQNDAPPARRQMLEQQIRQRLWQVAKRRLSLTEEQMTHLEQVSQRFDQRRRQLGQQEKAHRQALRAQILADTSANQGSISTALDGLQQVQRQRIELQIEEQKEFASFMTPLQRAKFLGLQEEFRKRMQELLRARPDSVGGPVLQSP